MKMIKYLLVLMLLCNVNTVFARCEPTTFTSEMLTETLVKSGLPKNSIDKAIKDRYEFVNNKCYANEPTTIISVKIPPVKYNEIEVSKTFLGVYTGKTYNGMPRSLVGIGGVLSDDIYYYPNFKKSIIDQLKLLEGRYTRLNKAGKNYKDELDTVRKYISFLTKSIDSYIELTPNSPYESRRNAKQYFCVNGVSAKGEKFNYCDNPRTLIYSYPEFEKEIIEFSNQLPNGY